MPLAVIAVVGGITIDLFIETERTLTSGESVRGTSLTKYSRGKAVDTAITAYRASHGKPSGVNEGTYGVGALCNDITKEMGAATVLP